MNWTEHMKVEARYRLGQVGMDEEEAVNAVEAFAHRHVHLDYTTIQTCLDVEAEERERVRNENCACGGDCCQGSR